MQTAKIYIWLIGAVLVTAPIFYAPPFYIATASAQSGQQSNTVLQLQQLQAEIAELRDMVERQQYQIRRLQNNQPPTQSSTAQGQVSNSANSSVGYTDDNRLGADASVANPPSTQVQPTSAPEYSAPSTNYPTPVSQSQVSSSQSDSVSASSWQTGADAAQADEDFYRPNSADNAIVDANPEIVSAARQARQANDTYPPVVDRSIGGAAANTVSAPVSSVATGTAAADTNIPSGRESVGSTPINANTVPTNATVVSNAPKTIITPAQVAAASQNQAPVASTPATSTDASQAGQVATPPSSGGVIQIPAAVQPNAAEQADAPQGYSSVLASAPVPQPAAVQLSEDVLYQQGFDLLKQFKYDDAVAVFKRQIDQYPSGSYADDAHYWVAESMYLNRKLGESKKYFRAIIDNFSQSPRVPDAMLKTAYIEQDQGNEIEARILLQEIMQYHPRSDAAISAKNRLEKLD